MNRLDRIAAIMIQLQSRPIVKAGQIAERFGVSLRTIYRDIRTLSEAGVPICGDAGVGYSLIEGYRLPPLMFTKEEALAFVTAEKFIEQLTDPQNSHLFRSGMDKIRAVLRDVDKGGLEQAGNHIEVYRNDKLPGQKFPNLIQIILKSIDEKQALRMNYFTPSRDDHTLRIIEAVGLSYMYPYWYLIGYCHWRQEYRNFRLDRIEDVETTGIGFSRKHPAFKKLLSDHNKSACLTKAILTTTRETSLMMGDTRYYFGLISEKEISTGVLEQTYMCYNLDVMARWTLSFADTTRVVEPQELKEKIKQIIKNIKL